MKIKTLSASLAYFGLTPFGVAAFALAAPLSAQDQGGPEANVTLPTETVYDGDYLSIGAGVGYGTSYTGSDDYRVFALPVIQGSYNGIDINPRPAGIAIDFIPDSATGPSFSGGIAGRVNFDRTDIDNIKDSVVESYGELDTAIEVGPTVGISYPAVLNPFDSLTVTVDALWDVAGAHEGMHVAPTVTYFTPLSQAIAVSLSASANYIDDDYADYYYSVPATNILLAPGSALPGFQAEGGFESVGANLLVAYDLGGNLADGGVSLIGIGGYSRLLNDAADSPFTSIRGSADQWLVAVGVGFTF